MEHPIKYTTGTGTVLSWASLLDDNTRLQAEMISRSKVVEGHIALMPDAHLGMGATVGCVIPTRDAIIPAAVGVDIGCGMMAMKTTLQRQEITVDAAGRILRKISELIPAGVGKGHEQVSYAADEFFRQHTNPTYLPSGLLEKGRQQFGTLGSGNHFAEVSADLNGTVWLLLHSGSRGIGNQLAMFHIRRALEYCRGAGIALEHPDLAYLSAGIEIFDDYIRDMLWAQEYAWAQREAMMTQLAVAVGSEADFTVVETIHCHHNYSEKQRDGTWLSRKGAIDANVGKRGIIPGSMGAETHIVSGLGNKDSYHSAPHGAGRLLARGAARRSLSIPEFQAQMQQITWNDRNAKELLDEAPLAYKPIKQVMTDASSLVRTETVLSQFINYKGY